MQTDALFPDAPQVLTDNGRHYVQVGWSEAESLRQVLRKRGCPTTLVLNPETRDARLELWPGVLPAAVQAVLDARQSPALGGALPTTSAAAPEPDKAEPAAADPTDFVCI